MYRPKRVTVSCPHCGDDNFVDVGGHGPNTHEAYDEEDEYYSELA